jgi:hypothetical protein
MNRTILFGWLKAGGIFIVCLFGARYLFPLIAVICNSFLPARLGNELFFFPQLAFPYEGLVFRDAFGSHRIVSNSIAGLLNILQWGLLAIGFSWATRYLKVRYTLLLAVAIIVIATYTIACIFPIFGAAIELDGP